MDEIILKALSLVQNNDFVKSMSVEQKHEYMFALLGMNILALRLTHHQGEVQGYIDSAMAEPLPTEPSKERTH